MAFGVLLVVRKPTYMKEILGWDVVCPDMRRNGWSVSSQALTVRQELESSGSFDILIGSSFGALAIANAVEGHEGDLRLALLAPAFGVYDTLGFANRRPSNGNVEEVGLGHSSRRIGRRKVLPHGHSWKTHWRADGLCFNIERSFFTGGG